MKVKFPFSKYHLKLGFVFVIFLLVTFIVGWLFAQYVWREDFNAKETAIKSFLPALILTVIWMAQNRRNSRKKAG